jgi:O-acetylhomoserine/O-acetylserine sulfhydrylase-like pyridoxal-dependent enzyme
MPQILALLFGSGSAAIASIIYLLGPGDHLIAKQPGYGGTEETIRDSSRFGISADYVSSDDIGELIKLIKPNTKVRDGFRGQQIKRVKRKRCIF